MCDKKVNVSRVCGRQNTIAQAVQCEHVGPKSSLGSDDSERIASQFSMAHTTYLPLARACLRMQWYFAVLRLGYLIHLLKMLIILTGIPVSAPYKPMLCKQLVA